MPETPTPSDSELPADFEASEDGQSPARPKAFVLRKQALPDFNDRLNKLAQTPAPKVPSIKEMRTPVSTPAPAPAPAPPPPAPPAAPEAPKRVLRPRPEMKPRSSGLPSLKDYAKVLDAPLPPPEPEPEQPAFPETPVAPSPEPISYPKPISYSGPPAESPATPAAAPSREFKLRSARSAPEASATPASPPQPTPGLRVTPPKSPEGPVSLPPRDPSDDSALFDAVVDASFSFVEETPPPPPSSAASPEPAKPEVKPAPASGGRMTFKSRVEKTDSTPADAPAPAPPPPAPVAKPPSPAPLPAASENDPAKPRLGLRPTGGEQSQSAQRISLPRQTDERTRPMGKPLHEQFDLNSLVAGEDGPTPAAELPPPPPGGRRASFTIKARPSPKADDAHDTVAGLSSPAQEKSNTPPVIYPRSSGTLPPLGRPQASGIPADPTRAPFSTAPGKKNETSRPFPAPAPAKTLPVGKIAVVALVLIGVAGYFGYDLLRSKFSSDPPPAGNTLVTPPLPPVVPPPSGENPVTPPKPDPDVKVAGTDTQVQPPEITPGNVKPAPPPPPPPPPAVVGIPPPAAEVAADPKVQNILESLTDYVALMKSGKAEQPTLLIRNIRYEVGKTVNEEHKLRYLGVQPSAKSPDKKEIVFEDGRGARYKLVF